MSDRREILKVTNLKKYFPVRQGWWQQRIGWVHAVDDVTLSVEAGEVMGLVGESGCGKTTLAQTVVGIHQPTAGAIVIDGTDTSRADRKTRMEIRKKVQIVFQDPFWSLNPRKMIRDIVGEPLVVHGMATGASLTRRVGELLEMVAIDPGRMFSYPHDFSGGERQRVAIARSIALNPALLLLDEPTSSIDTLSQAEILNLLIDIRDRFGLAYVLISHDLSVVHYLSDRIAVMYLGKVVEYGPTRDVYVRTFHPYTRALMQAVPVIHPSGETGTIKPLEGNVPSAVFPPPGCRFHTRCPQAQAVCTHEEPRLTEVSPGHLAACHLVGEDSGEKRRTPGVEA